MRKITRQECLMAMEERLPVRFRLPNDSFSDACYLLGIEKADDYYRVLVESGHSAIWMNIKNIWIDSDYGPDKGLVADLRDSSSLLRDYLLRNHHPHVTAIVTSHSIELVEGLGTYRKRDELSGDTDGK